MKMRYYKAAIAVFAAFFIGFQARSQDIYLGVKGGIGIPNLKAGSGASEISKGYSSRLGPYFGVFGDFHLTRVFSLQPEINYSSQGGKKDGRQAIPAQEFNPQAPANTFVYANYKSNAKLNYIEVPVLAKFTFPLGEKWNFIVDAGPYVGFLASAKNVTSGSSYVYADRDEQQALTPQPVPFDSTDDIKDQIHTANVGIQGGVGLSLKLNESYLFVHAGGNYGFMNIQKNPINGKNHTGAATVVVGYALRLNGK
jgi:hypothetical protein